MEDPTLYNPNNITQLSNLTTSYLADILLNKGNNATRNGFGCGPASLILPLANISMLILDIEDNSDEHNTNLTVSVDPTQLNPGISHLRDMARGLFPYPLNESGVGDIVNWWADNTENHPVETTQFLSAVVNMCGGEYCRSGQITVGNPDIVGIGMIVAIAVLLCLTIAFSLLSFGPLVDIVARAPYTSRKKRFSLRVSCIGTVDELFSAVFVFALAVMVSTLVFRYKTDTRFDALMANALSQLCSTTVVMLAAVYWCHNKQRPHATGSVLLMAILTIALYTTHAGVANMRASAAEMACGIGKGRVSLVRGDPFDMKKFNFIPVGFGSWFLALIGAVFHHPWLNKYRPTKNKKKIWRVLWKTAESFPSVFGLIGLAVYMAYFFNTWQMMKGSYGKTFSQNVREWGFGQYLAVFTWLPPLLTFSHLYISGMEKAIERRLPHGWIVVQTPGEVDYRGDGGGDDQGESTLAGSRSSRSRVREVDSLAMSQAHELGNLLQTSPKATKATTQETVYPIPSPMPGAMTSPVYYFPDHPSQPPTPYTQGGVHDTRHTREGQRFTPRAHNNGGGNGFNVSHVEENTGYPPTPINAPGHHGPQR
ncbi:hypothetical protein QBC40DRAFT_81498 [Triangularia verruculosa]|uniref:Uncharacterized protein n=1 Tax=Triangularia verruculosa TaxID=2587418 RepID=A0AAN6XF09_9PEZI|nr:hypothetical protein QBC40DRAFT_81498 [Triangularia verruculosa]